eukprot:gene6079-7575_t
MSSYQRLKTEESDFSLGDDDDYDSSSNKLNNTIELIESPKLNSNNNNNNSNSNQDEQILPLPLNSINNGDDLGNSSSIDINDNNAGETTNLIPSTGDNNKPGEEMYYEDDDDDEVGLEDFSQMIVTILIPVSITMMIVVWAVKTLDQTSDFSSGYNGFAMVYNENPSDSSGSKLWTAVINSLIFVAAIIVTTVCFVILYKYKCLKVIYAWLFASVFLMLGSLGGYYFLMFLNVYGLAMDYVTYFFLLANFAAGGILSIFWYSPSWLNQAYLVVVSALTATSLSRLPNWTTFAILAAVAIYDIFAVLCPGGPLRVLVETAQERNETIPALIYNASYDLVEYKTVEVTNDEGEVEKKVEIVKKKRSLKLGLGDFIFYSLLMSRAAMFDMSVVFTCFIAIITGLFMTLLLLAIFKKALPALPISIAFGIIFYFLSSFFLYPYIVSLGMSQVYV